LSRYAEVRRQAAAGVAERAPADESIRITGALPDSELLSDYSHDIAIARIVLGNPH
jgi:hypothetical protein